MTATITTEATAAVDAARILAAHDANADAGSGGADVKARLVTERKPVSAFAGFIE
jgi:hypothetical protein